VSAMALTGGSYRGVDLTGAKVAVGAWPVTRRTSLTVGII
jgi:hypothetical protein